MKISEIITDRYKLRIPPTVYYELLADIQEVEEDQEPITKNDLALLEKTYADFCSCEGGEGWLKIDGKEYSTDAGYALEGMSIFMEVFKQRLAELSSVTPQEPTTKNDLGVYCISRILVQSSISKSIEYKENPYQLY